MKNVNEPTSQLASSVQIECNAVCRLRRFSRCVLPLSLLVHVSDVVSEDVRVGVADTIGVQISDSSIACG